MRQVSAKNSKPPYDSNHMTMSTPELPDHLATLLPPALHSLCHLDHYKRHTYLFQIGQRPQWMFFVLLGEITLERMGLGGDLIILQRTRHGFVSEASLQTSAYHCDARVVSASDVWSVPIPALLQQLHHDPAFAMRWISMCNLEIRRLRLQRERLGLKTIQEKLIHLVETEGQNGQYDVRSGLKTLASELSVTHEALYRTLASLGKTGQLVCSNGTLRRSSL